jgi:hypothetical protein
MQMKPSSYQVHKAKSYLICGKSNKQIFHGVGFHFVLNKCPILRRLNTCPFQGSRTIRTEEAVLISLAAICPALAKSARSEEKVAEEPEEDIEFSDESPSDESSDEDDGSASEKSSGGDSD